MIAMDSERTEEALQEPMIMISNRQKSQWPSMEEGGYAVTAASGTKRGAEQRFIYSFVPLFMFSHRIFMQQTSKYQLPRHGFLPRAYEYSSFSLSCNSISSTSSTI